MSIYMHACQIRELRDRVEKQMEAKLESAEELLPVSTRTAAAAAAAVYIKDGLTDSDSSAVFNEEASPAPYSGAALDQQQQQQQTGHQLAGFTGFTSFLASSFPSIYHGDSHLDQEADGFFSAGAGADGFFAEEQSTGIGSWYGGEGW
jgi:hypothetical protein